MTSGFFAVETLPGALNPNTPTPAPQRPEPDTLHLVSLNPTSQSKDLNKKIAPESKFKTLSDLKAASDQGTKGEIPKGTLGVYRGFMRLSLLLSLNLNTTESLACHIEGIEDGFLWLLLAGFNFKVSEDPKP